MKTFFTIFRSWSGKFLTNQKGEGERDAFDSVIQNAQQILTVPWLQTTTKVKKTEILGQQKCASLSL